jgi:prepilin-type N-terminal cleavage/methylation domain-containing protein
MKSVTRRLRASAGFTLVEVVVATAILGVLSAVALGLLERAQRIETEAITRADLRVKARIALDRIARELRDSGPSTLEPSPLAPLGASSLTFRRATGYDADCGTVTFGAARRLEWQPSPDDPEDGEDNDGDEVVDEGRVVFIDNPGSMPSVEVVICENVARLGDGETSDTQDNNGNGLVDERGLSFDLVQNVLTVRLTLERRTRRGDLVRMAAETAILLQNP